jgi:hypothetical protein
MFAPSNHLGRSFGAPGTTRRARNNENSGVHLPTKTPIRAPLGGGGGGPFKPGPGTVGRPLGLKTVERNVLGSKSDHPVEDIGRCHLTVTFLLRQSRSQASFPEHEQAIVIASAPEAYEDTSGHAPCPSNSCSSADTRSSSSPKRTAHSPPVAFFPVITAGTQLARPRLCDPRTGTPMGGGSEPGQHP